MIIAMASPENAQAILDLQRLAFGYEAELYGDDRLPPLTQTLDELRSEFGHRLILKFVDGGLVLFEHAGHMNFPETYPDLYQRSVLGFLRGIKKQID
jgi:hypothetical protein